MTFMEWMFIDSALERTCLALLETAGIRRAGNGVTDIEAQCNQVLANWVETIQLGRETGRFLSSRCGRGKVC